MESKIFDVVAIGNAIVDVLINTQDSFLAENSLSKGNMILINQDKAEELYSKSLPDLETSGGSAANTSAPPEGPPPPCRSRSRCRARQRADRARRAARRPPP